MREDVTEEKLVLALGSVPDVFKKLKAQGFQIREFEETDELLNSIDDNDQALVVVDEESQEKNLSQLLKRLKEADHTNPILVLVKEGGKTDYSDADYEGVVHAYSRDEKPSILIQGALRAIVRNAVMTEED